MTFGDFLAGEPEASRAELRDLFRGLPQNTTVKAALLAPGELCMREGDQTWDVYVLTAGIVDLYTQQANYTVYALRDFTPFALFGHYEALADSEAIAADVKARTECRFLVISKKAYLRWVQSDIAVLMTQTRSSIATLLSQGSRDRETLTLQSDVRIAMFLHNYYRANAGGAKNGTVVVTLSHNAIAEAVGLSVRTITRKVTALRKQNILGLLKGKITISAAQANLLQNLKEE